MLVIGIVAGEASTTNRELLWDHPVQVAGFNMRHIFTHEPQQLAQLLPELMAVLGATPPAPAALYALEDGPKLLAEMESRATMGKLALTP